MQLRLSSLFLTILLLCVLSLDASAQTGKNPVIIIPGLEGSEILEHDGSRAWFSVRRRKDDDLRLPITSTVLSHDRDSLRTGDIIRKVDIRFLPDVEVYQGLIDALKSKGYKEATWTHPKAADCFYVFPYDWRRDNVESAHLLMQHILGVVSRLHRPDLKFDIMAHSMGGLIARYAAMYGAAALPAKDPVPTWAGAEHINKLMMFGTPNQGAFSAFDAMLNGEPLLGRDLPFVDDFRAEDVFTLPASYQLLPHPGTARFLDDQLKPIEVDLYDPNTWFKYKWGALSDPKYLSKLRDAAALARTDPDIKPKPFTKGSVDDRLTSHTTFAQAKAFFTTELLRAKRFAAALDAPSDKQPVEIYIYGGNCEQTADGAILLKGKNEGEWETVVDAKDVKTADGRAFKKDEIQAAIFSLGDGRVTQQSLVDANKPLATNAKIEFFGNSYPIASSLFTCESHTKLFLEQSVQDSFLSALVVSKHGQP
jgi:pimeloyl-ACP methyl ester carboxylesterase